MLLQQFYDAMSIVVIKFGETELTVGKMLQAPLILLAIWLVLKTISRLVNKALKAKQLGADATHLFNRIYWVVTLVVMALSTMYILNIPLTAFAFVSGAVAIGVGFGAQNIINNFISGWILMWERPIRIGDFLEVGDAKGRVETINTRSTRIRRNDGVHMMVPNSQLLENTVTNWTLMDTRARTFVRVGVAYGADVKLVSKLMHEIVCAHESTIDIPEPEVIFEDFGDNALIFDAVFWTDADSEFIVRHIKSDIRFAIYDAFAEHDIVIAFPQRDVHLDGELRITR